LDFADALPRWAPLSSAQAAFLTKKKRAMHVPLQNEYDPRLKHALEARHISMLALGNVIGAGLFVGSNAVIGSTGSGAFITYFITGIIVAHAAKGSFVDYARMAFDRPAGYMTGWLYCCFWGIVFGFEAVVGGQITSGWLSCSPMLAIDLGLMGGITLLNLMLMQFFGEAEYWFAGIKVAAIIVFLVVAGAYAFYLRSHSTASFVNLTEYGRLPAPRRGLAVRLRGGGDLLHDQHGSRDAGCRRAGRSLAQHAPKGNHGHAAHLGDLPAETEVAQRFGRKGLANARFLGAPLAVAAAGLLDHCGAGEHSTQTCTSASSCAWSPIPRSPLPHVPVGMFRARCAIKPTGSVS